MSSMDANKKKHYRTGAVLIFIIYIAALIYFLFFSERLGRSAGLEYRYNFTPFKEIMRYVRQLLRHPNTYGMISIVNLLGNVVVFMPFGYLIPRVLGNRINIIHATLVGMEFSILVELLQLITKKGCCDVDDVILNTIGAFLGYVFYYFVRRKRD